jgi:alkylation response protein AidB-like acyl-CoA dehydrogenase
MLHTPSFRFLHTLRRTALPRAGLKTCALATDVAAFQEQMRAFAQESLAPHAAAIDKLNGYPTDFEFWRKAGEWGLHGEHCICFSVKSIF